MERERQRRLGGKGFSAAYNQVLFGAPLPGRTGNSDEAGPIPHSAKDETPHENASITTKLKNIDANVRNRVEVTTVIMPGR